MSKSNKSKTNLPSDASLLTTKKPKTVKEYIHFLTHNKYSYLSFCFIIPLLLMRIIYMCVGNLPGLDGSVLVLDLNGQYVYFYEALRDFLHGDGSLLYSFSRALGGEFLGIYAYYVASPLALIVGLFPEGKILEALLLIFVLKTGFCGLTFGYYLHKTNRRINRYTSIMFSTMYALCSYAIVQSHNSMWIDALIWLPIITLSLEDLIKKGSYKLYVISLAVMLSSHYYIGYMVCIYIAIYFFYYYIANRPSIENSGISHFIKSLAKIVFSSILGIGIAAFVLIGAYTSLRFGKSSFSTPDWDLEFRYGIADLMAKFLPGAYDTVRPEGLPFVYCGTLTLILLPFYYFAKKISTREKICSTLLVAIFIISFMFNPLDIIWHGFQVPNWLNYRYSFILCFILLVMAYKAFKEINKHTPMIAFITGGALIGLTIFLYNMEFENFVLGEKGKYTENHLDTYRTLLFTIVAVIAICIALFFLKRASTLKSRRRATKALLTIVCIEMLLNGIVNITALHFDVTYSSNSSYNGFFDKISPVIEEIQANDDSFYRMEKTHHRKTNDAMTLDMNGLSCSTSTLNKETVKFLANMGYASKSHWSKYLGGNPVSDSILGVKYVVFQKDQPSNYSTYRENQALNSLMSKYYTVVAEDESYIGYENPYALSLAYQVSDSIKALIFNTVDNNGNLTSAEPSPFERINDIASAMYGSEIQVFVPVNIANTKQTNVRKSAITGHTKYEKIDSNQTASVTFEIKAPNNNYLYFYAPTNYSREADFYVNSKKYGDIMAKESNRIKAMGAFQKGSTVTVKLNLKSTTLYLRSDEYYFYYLDMNELQKLTDKLSQNEFIIEKFSDTRLSGKITTDDSSSSIFTSIPYDEGWKVYVDGKKTEIYKNADALIGFDINESGTHTLKLVYRPIALTLGLPLSIFSIALFAVIWYYEAKYNEKKQKELEEKRKNKKKKKKKKK